MTVDVCTTCLFEDDDLVVISEDNLQILSDMLQPNNFGFQTLLNGETKTCYSCHERLQEISNFRDTVQHALETLEEQLKHNEQAKEVPPLAPETFSPSATVQHIKDGDHSYIDRVESPPPGDVVKSELRNDMEQEENAGQWYIKVLTNDEILAHVVSKRRQHAFVTAAYKCTRCVIVFKDKEQARLHITQCHDKTIGPFICFICTRRFRTLVEMHRHIPLHCSNVYVCARCNYDTYDKDAMLAHTCTKGPTPKPKPTHVQREKDWKCLFCSKTFKSRIGVLTHVGICHNNQPKKQCLICSRTFKNHHSLQAHMRYEHSEPEDKSDYCDDCDHTFLQTHLQNPLQRRSEDDFNFLCDQCDGKFFYEQDLQDHIKIVHLIERPFQCSSCNKSFATLRGRKRHVTIAHKLRPNTYKCEVCDAALASKMILEAHMRRHTGEQPYQCEYCTSTFSFSGALYKHQQQRHGVGSTSRGTGGVSQDTGGVNQDTGGVSQDTGGVSQDTCWVNQDTCWVSQDTGWVSHDTGWVSQDTGWVSRATGGDSQGASQDSPVTVVKVDSVQIIPFGPLS